jgi:TolB protein
MGLWTAKADGSDWQQVFPANKEPHFDGHWFTDSKKIAFVFDRLQGTDGKLQIDTINRDGSDHKNLIPHQAFEESPRWSPDGTRLMWVTTRNGNQEIYTVTANGQNPTRLTSDPGMDNNPSWSPDGKQIAFCSSRKGSRHLRDEGRRQRRPPAHDRPRHRLLARVVPGRQAHCVHLEPRRQLRDLRDERGRQQAA